MGIRKYRYFVKYQLDDGTTNVKIVLSEDPEKVWMAEVKEDVLKGGDTRNVVDILKCRKYENFRDGFDGEELLS